jgi:hypothetical protein
MKPEEPGKDEVPERVAWRSGEVVDVAGLTGLIEGVRERALGRAGVLLGCGGMTVLRVTARGMGNERTVDFFLFPAGFLPH